MSSRTILWLYRQLLRCLPSEFRSQYGLEMETAFSVTLERTHRSPHVIGRAALDVVATSVELRWAARRSGQQKRPRARRWDGFFLDAPMALRRLRKSPGFTAASVLTLALGIATTCTVFAVVDSVLLRPLPYGHPDRLVAVFLDEITRGNPRAPTSPRNFHAWREESTTLELMTAATPWAPILQGRERPEQLHGLKASASLFELLEVPASLGRTLGPGDSQVVVLGYELWQRQFGADPDVVGSSLTLDGEPYTVTGIMPAGFKFPPFWAVEAEMWTPLIFTEAEAQRNARFLRVFARLKPDTELQRAQREMTVIGERLVARFPEANAGTAVQTEALQEPVVAGVRPALLILLGAVSLVMLIACVNVAGLVTVRVARYRQETALQAALGASRWRLAAPSLVEGLVLSTLAGALGLVGASFGLKLLRVFAPQDLPRVAELELGGASLLFTFLTCAITALAVGLLPAFAAAGRDASGALKASGRGSARNALVVFEVAISVVLLTSAALLARTYWHLQDVEPGFRRDGAVTMTVVLDPGLRGDTGRQRLLLDELQTAVAAVPGVSGAAFVNHLPIGGDLWGITFSRVDRPASNAAERPRASLRVATPAYFETMRIPLLEGRVFTSSDASSEPVILINETSAKRYWPDESPVGRQIQIGALGKEDPKWRVIGIVGDVQQQTLTEPIRPELYFPYSQNPAAEYGMTSLVVHTSVPGDAVIGPVRDAIWNVDETLAVTNVRSMGQILSDSVWQQRFNSMLMGILALLALSLAAVGLFGVVSYAVSRRVREMAIRAAVGARPRDLMTQVLGEGLRMTALGAVLGCVAAYFAAEVLSSLLYGVPTTDWISYVGAATLLTAVSLAASYLPARRAAGLPPTAALRSD